jgi:hypothetical protein
LDLLIKSQLLYRLSYAPIEKAREISGVRSGVTALASGEGARDRTLDLLVKSQLLYRLSYAPM